MKLQANGIEVHYELTGPDKAPVVTFSHSLLANLSMWDPQVEALQEYRVLRYDTRGHGQSDATDGEYDLALLAADAIALLDALEIRETHFVGLSLGGMVAQELALNHADRIESLVLCDTRGHTSTEHSERRAKRIAIAQKDGIEPMVDTILESWFSNKFRKANQDVMDSVAEMIRSTSVDGLVGCTHAINHQSHTPQLSEITAPTLVMVGEEDPATPLPEAWSLHEHINGSEMVVLPKARHLPNIERAKEFNDELIRFLK